jgi:hypothetical protein
LIVEGPFLGNAALVLGGDSSFFGALIDGFYEGDFPEGDDYREGGFPGPRMPNRTWSWLAVGFFSITLENSMYY